MTKFKYPDFEKRQELLAWTEDLLRQREKVAQLENEMFDAQGELDATMDVFMAELWHENDEMLPQYFDRDEVLEEAYEKSMNEEQLLDLMIKRLREASE